MVLRSLGSRLFLSYALVVLLALFTAALSLVYLLQGYDRRLALTRLADVAVPLNVYVRNLRELGVTSQDLITYVQAQADQLEVRILLVNRQGMIIHDTTTPDELVGDHLILPIEQLSADRRQMYSGHFRSADGRSWILVALPLIERPRSAPVDAAILVVAQPDRPFGAAFVELLQQLILALLVALGAAIVFAFAVSRSLARPLSQITRASSEMALGRYEQRVPVEGPEELERLATSFNRMAAEVDRSRRVLREFVANVSHELRTPLTAINGFVVALQDGTVSDPEEQLHALITVDAETRRLQRLVAQLLDLSRIESGQLPLAWQPVDLSAVLSDCIEIFALRADETSIEIRAELPPSLIVQGDPDRLEQVFNNLIDNALKYTPAGGRVIVRATPDTTTARVDVIDTGRGIPAEDQDRVFDRFFRVDKSRSGNSSGLGLAIVREIVRAHGGSIALESTVDRGSRFSVTLPIARAAPATHLNGRGSTA